MEGGLCNESSFPLHATAPTPCQQYIIVHLDHLKLILNHYMVLKKAIIMHNSPYAPQWKFFVPQQSTHYNEYTCTHSLLAALDVFSARGTPVLSI